MAVPLPPLCPMQGGKCGVGGAIIKQSLSVKPYLFIAFPSSEAFNDTENAIRTVIEGGKVFHQKYRSKKIGGKQISALVAREERFIGQGTCKICQLCWFCD